ncbi:hypothetical protein V8E54_000943 [Elaphomyces granulatus]
MPTRKGKGNKATSAAGNKKQVGGTKQSSQTAHEFSDRNKKAQQGYQAPGSGDQEHHVEDPKPVEISKLTPQLSTLNAAAALLGLSPGQRTRAICRRLQAVTTPPCTRYTINIPPFFWRPASVVLETGRTCRRSETHNICGHLVTFSLRAENHLATFPPSFQVLHKSTIVHIASSQKDSGCPGVEVEVGVPATERDKGDRELETADRAGGVDLRRLPYQNVYGVEKRFHVCTMETLSWPSSPALSISHSSSVAKQESSLSSFVSTLELHDVLQPQHQLLFGDGDTVVELALRAELPQKVATLVVVSEN